MNGCVVKSKRLEDLVLALQSQGDEESHVSMKVCRRDLSALAPIVSARSRGVSGACDSKREGPPGVLSRQIGASVMRAERPLSRDEIDLVPSLTIIEGAVQTHFVDGLGPLEGAERKELELVVENLGHFVDKGTNCIISSISGYLICPLKLI